MSFDLIMRAIAEHWDSVESHLTGETARQFRLLVGRFAAAGEPATDRLDAAEELLDLLVSALPAALPADHPVRRAIADPAVSRGAPTIAAAEDEALLAELRRLSEPQLHALFDPAAPGPAASHPAGQLPPEEIAQDAMRRLLAVPALSAAELRRRGADPDQEHLIRLDDRGDPRFPVFQFDAAGQPRRLVLGINAILDAEADPWGVADWWLGRNAWLSRSPAESIGLVADEVLVATARDLVEASG